MVSLVFSKVKTLRTGDSMPVLGFGLYKIPNGIKAEKVVREALEVGYRLFDTAAFYGNEQSLGKAIRKSGIPREEFFITTKLHPFRLLSIERAFFQSLKKLGTDYVDLYLIHWPFMRTKTVWNIFERIQKKGYAKAIGVSNFSVHDIESLVENHGSVPAVNQVEFHPFLYRKALLAYCQSKGIVLEAHTPLTHGKRIADPRVASIAKRYEKTPAQILLRWGIQHGAVCLPKTTSKERMKENITIFDFSLVDDDMERLDSLNENDHIAGISRVMGDRAI
ncbi:MAG: hypothetical protein A3C10_02455 [Candidatus Magasanikbacteria bacterium RIFCSPHIGHO2_02_FULL_48_18]|nr:MAG: hypothetical protein A3I74_00770 [Candidatus Magasanikbacteria bacterium RIFCSPLOWO2_02_FULL_47_16]OGH80022.1 MAG: hypothetical protein A3C10_02455 [Candidatus Magasanikbacteria bacterium RIFCSPHIGHO2_02_FULL_48_18]